MESRVYKIFFFNFQFSLFIILLNATKLRKIAWSYAVSWVNNKFSYSLVDPPLKMLRFLDWKVLRLQFLRHLQQLHEKVESWKSLLLSSLRKSWWLLINIFNILLMISSLIPFQFSWFPWASSYIIQKRA